MSERDEFEDTLRGFHHDIDAARPAVMSAFESAAFGLQPRQPRFWKRQVPLYAATAAVVLAIALSFVTGHQWAVRQQASTPQSVVDGAVSGTPEWRAAERDLL